MQSCSICSKIKDDDDMLRGKAGAQSHICMDCHLQNKAYTTLRSEIYKEALTDTLMDDAIIKLNFRDFISTLSAAIIKKTINEAFSCQQAATLLGVKRAGLQMRIATLGITDKAAKDVKKKSPGVIKNTARSGWCVQITIKLDKIRLGSYATKEEANAVYMAAKRNKDLYTGDRERFLEEILEYV